MKEYRVIWQREDWPLRREIYQTLKGAERCAERQRTAEWEMNWLEGRVAPISFGPVIECREVGEWEELR